MVWRCVPVLLMRFLSAWLRQADVSADEDLQEVQLAMFMSQWAAGDIPGLVARSVEAEAVANSRAGEGSDCCRDG